VPDDKVGSRNGWYVLYLDGIACGVFGSWKAGDSHKWTHRKPRGHAEAEFCRERQEQAKRQRETEQQGRQMQAAALARRLWRNAHPASPEHPYLGSKRVGAYGLRQANQTLLVPLTHGGQ